MKSILAIILFAASCSPAFAVETFEQAWATRWRPQVEGSFMSRRFEPQIKAACQEVWNVAQQNMPTGGAVRRTPAQSGAVQLARPTKGVFSVGPRRRGFFRRRHR